MLEIKSGHLTWVGPIRLFYLVKWVIKAQGKEGAKNLKKWVTSFMDDP